MAVASARFLSPIFGARASALSLLPAHDGQTRSVKNLETLLSRFSSVARSSSLVTVSLAFLNVKSSSWTPFTLVTVMCFFSSGPAKTISRSSCVNSLNGTSVRTPNSRTISGCTLQPNIRQGATAPSSMLRLWSGTMALSFTSRTIAVPEHLGHAPAELNASDSAPGGVTVLPQSGHFISTSAATFIDGFK